MGLFYTLLFDPEYLIWIYLLVKKKIIKCDKIQFKRYTHLYLLIYAPVMLCIVIEFKACFYSANEK